MSMQSMIHCLSGLLVALFVLSVVNADELDDIQRMLETGQIGEAAVRLNNYRRSHPDDPRALLFRARLTDEPNQARALLREVELLSLRKNPADSVIASDAVHAAAELEYSTGNIGIAVSSWERLIRQYPQSARIPDARYQMGIIALKNGDKLTAIAHFDSCLAIADNGEIRSLAATGRMECYVQLGQWRDALDAAHAVLEEDDEESAVTPRVLEVMAMAWRQLGNEENSNRFTQRLLETYPESIQAHTAREAGKKLAAETAIPADGSAAAITPGAVSQTTIPSRINAPLSSGPAFAVQASAFTDRANAYRMYRELRENGFDASIDMRTVGEQHFYKVLVGRFATRDEAERNVDSVSRATGVRAIVVVLE